MEALMTAGIFIFVSVLEHPFFAASAGCALLLFLCRVDGGLAPLFAFAAYCALAAAAYMAGAAFIETPWVSMGGLVPLGIMIGLFPLVFGSLWYFIRRSTKRGAKRK